MEETKTILGFVYFIEIKKHLRSMMTIAITIIIITVLSPDTIAVETVFIQ
jgi:hypothetical protein